MAKITFKLFVPLSVIAASIFMQTVFHASPMTLEKYLLAQVGVTVGVSSNPFNTLSQQLQEKESTLSAKEQDLQQKEISLREKEKEKESKTIFYLSIAGGVLLALIFLNFYFDYRRKNKGTL